MMRKASFLLMLACIASCRTQKPNLYPPGDHSFRSLSVKFSFQDRETRQSGRIVWRCDENNSKFIFFTPLNQAGLELDVTGEDAVLINFARKEYWRGEFRVLLERIWGVNMNLADLRALLLAGKIPEEEFACQGIKVDLERGPAGGATRAVRLRRNSADLSLRITKDESRTGKIVMVRYEERYRTVNLDKVLEND